MGVNRNKPHVFVLPEDDADRRVANGFRLQLAGNAFWQMQVLPVAGGWNRVLTLFENDHLAPMGRFPNRFMVLLIDFDNDEARLEVAKRSVPEHLTNRVFILGSLTEPEALKPDLGSLETIGSKMAEDCRADITDRAWGHRLLRHNSGELDRFTRTPTPDPVFSHMKPAEK
ncbi:MAG TPA: hypothetical protein VNW97_09880 [Candidatus Saccharimonadales bacterium]|jgi:hypothetical protein|nr:hypothetical protein [Candidatus Saccharimonadales bacterium]